MDDRYRLIEECAEECQESYEELERLLRASEDIMRSELRDLLNVLGATARKLNSAARKTAGASTKEEQTMFQAGRVRFGRQDRMGTWDE